MIRDVLCGLELTDFDIVLTQSLPFPKDRFIFCKTCFKFIGDIASFVALTFVK